MTNPATLATIAAQVRDLADQPSSGGFAVDARVYDYINHALSELWDILVTHYEDYGRATQTLTLVAGTESYAMPTDYLKTLKVFYLSGGNRYVLQRFHLDELDKLSELHMPPSLDEYRLRYRMLGKSMYFAPKPLRAGTVEHWYVTQAPQFDPAVPSGVIDTIVPVGWEEFLITSAAHRLLVREDNAAQGGVLQLKEAAKQRIIEAAATRDIGGANTVGDVAGRFSPAWVGITS